MFNIWAPPYYYGVVESMGAFILDLMVFLYIDHVVFVVNAGKSSVSNRKTGWRVKGCQSL